MVFFKREACCVKETNQIQTVCDVLVERYQPQKIILYTQKSDLSGNVSSFKLCMIATVKDRRAVLREIYLTVESDIPFDILLYTPEEWEQWRQTEGTFAQKIDRSGRVLYG